MLMEMYMMDNGLTIKPMALESIVILTVQNMKDIGKKINNMVTDWKPGQMAPNTKANTFKEKNMEPEGSHGLMEVPIMVILLKTTSKVKENITGLMEESTTVTG